MTYLFEIRYETHWGEELKMKVGKKLLDMEYAGEGLWKKTLKASEIKSPYSYVLCAGDGIIRTEWRSHVLPPVSGRTVQIRDRWQERPVNSPFWSSAFTDVIFRREGGKSFRNPGEALVEKDNLILEVAFPEVRPGEAVGVVGSWDEWDTVRVMDDDRFPYWRVEIPVSGPVEYKYVLVNPEKEEIKEWEKGPNRTLEVDGKTIQVIRTDVPSFGTLPWRGAGTAVPVFSLRTEDSFGIGEFHDLKKMVDWAVATGQNVIQILPVNDTSMTGTWQDSYPYNAVSSFALHPQFIHLPDAGVRRDKAYKALQAELNALPQIDYERVNSEKKRLLKKVFAAKWPEIEASPEYSGFLKENKEWLISFAVFSALKDEKGTPDFTKWGKEAKYSSRLAASYHKSHKEEVDFYLFEQYLLDVQLKDVVRYAHKRGVVLKGDLPIGVSRTSADAWTEPDLFNLDSQAGAPPDAFSTDGQNWGFPTYNWERMEETGFDWWKRRLKKMNEYFDAYRIDHILGFFRIWEIPYGIKSGLLGHFSPALPYSGEELQHMGFDAPALSRPGVSETDVLFVEDPRKKGYYHPRISAVDTPRFQSLSRESQDRFRSLHDDFFYRRHNSFWKESAYRKLPSLLRSSGMLSCGEDLGMIPACVPETMDDLTILSLEIQRMPKDVHVEFARTELYPYLCVCATGTHDTSPLRAWWEEDRASTQRFYNEILGCDGDAPYFCEPWIAERIVSQHLKSPAMLAVLPLQDWLAIDGEVRYNGNPADERINIPANPRHYWRYRMHCTLESLLENTALSARIRGLVAASARGR